MEELVEHLMSIKIEVDGVEMVPLSEAIQSVQTASTANLLQSLDDLMANLSTTFEDIGDSTEQ
jgi:hypothetical protein